MAEAKFSPLGMAETTMSSKVPEMIEAVSSSQLMRIMECPICQEVPFPPIYQCVNGHSICKICKPKVKACPTCRAVFSTGRNYVAEQIVHASKHECFYKNEGCKFQTTGDLMEAHIATCQYRSFDCPWNGCDACTSTGLTLAQATEHLLEFHKGIIVKGQSGVVERIIDFEYFKPSSGYFTKPDFNWPAIDFQFDDKHFFADVFTIKHTIYWSFLLIGSEDEAKEYRVKITSQPGKKHEIQWIIPVWSVLNGRKLKDPNLTATRFLPSCSIPDFRHLVEQSSEDSSLRFSTRYEIMKREQTCMLLVPIE